ncbi:MAG: hypothetical protein WKG00_36495 [Polyangiaceae bacterium]
MTKRTRAVAPPPEASDEVTSVRRTLRMVADVDIDLRDGDRGPFDPCGVYATPHVLVNGQRIAFARTYFLGTRFPTGIVASATWESEMRADSVSARLIYSCREYLRSRAL